MLTKMILLTAAAIFVTYKIVNSDGDRQQGWIFAGFVLVVLFGGVD